MSYTNKVLQHFKDPKNQGTIPNADAVGEVGNPTCGDVMKIYLKIKKDPLDKGGRGDYIEDVKFETLGCAAAIAVSSAFTEIVKGKTIDEAMKITKDKIVEELGGLPEQKIHCSMLAVEALHEAIKNYKN